MVKTKRQKKFESRHLKASINHKKHVQHIKRRRREAVEVIQEKAARRAAQEAAAVPEDLAQQDVDAFLNGSAFDGSGSGSDAEMSGNEGSDLASDLEEGSDEDVWEVSERSQRATPAAKKGGARGSDASSSSEEDEAGASGTGAALKKDSSRLKGEIDAHRSQLEKLKAQDPEFYEYLQQSDQNLLKFGQDSEDEEEDEGDEEEAAEASDLEEAEEVAPGSASRDSAKQPKASLTLDTVESWGASLADKRSMTSFRRLLKAFRAACHYGDAEEGPEDGNLGIGSAAVFNRVLLLVLREADGALRHLLGFAPGRAVAPPAVARQAAWKKVEPLIKSYFGSALHLLSCMTDPAMMSYVLRRVRVSAWALTPLPRLQRRAMKMALEVFARGKGPARVQAVVLARAVALDTNSEASAEACLKGSYRAFAHAARFQNKSAATELGFMQAAVLQLYVSLPQYTAYGCAFRFVRELALQLRTALTNRDKTSYRAVYSWSTLRCLELWADLLVASHRAAEGASAPTAVAAPGAAPSATLPPATTLAPLVYPVSQLLLGVAALMPSPGYFPVRLRCLAALVRLGGGTATFVPATAPLLDLLQWPAFAGASKAKGATPARLDLDAQLHLSKGALSLPPIQEELATRAVELVAVHLSHWACSVAFPEVSHLPLVALRKFSRGCRNERLRKLARLVADALARNATYVARARDRLECSPKDAAAVDAFLAREKAARQAPLQQATGLLLERAQQRMALRRQENVRVGREKFEDGADLGPAVEEEELPEPQDQVLPTREHAREAANQRRALREEPKEEAAGDGGQEGDVVNAYELSEDEEGDDGTEGDEDSDEGDEEDERDDDDDE